MGSNTQDNVNLAQGAPTVAVGQSLKTARELTGKPIAEVAVQLRIRQPFLEALEEGRHKDLPGGTYAVGFLRTYAEFLGMDGEEMVRRFRAEAAGDLNARSELVFPSPVSEGRIPGGAVLFLGVILAGIGYGVWYWVSASQSPVAEMVPPLPERLASVLNRPATLTGDATKPAEPAKAEETVPSATDAPPAAGGKVTEMVPPPEEDDDAKPATPAQPAAPVQTASPAAPASPAMQPAPPAAEPAAKVEPPKAEAVKPAPAPEPAKAEAVKPMEPPAAAPQATVPTATPAPEGKVIGQEHADSRIQLKAANDDCWVQVREMDGQLLLSRLLRRGDSYMVPNRPGLTLMAGNAGALDVLVDGKKAPSLGNAGQVRRDIKLDADKLLSGS